jgi:type IX secretion system PorP/SprF family membrane protein
MKKLSTLALRLLFSFCLIALGSSAQDIHYSQFYASPLTLNPALTGINNCSYRVTALYRNQWSSVPAPYSTPSLSFDINSLAPKYVKYGNLSAGLLIYNDRSGDGHLNNLSIVGSGGYAINPDVNRKHTVSVGVQVGYTQKRVDEQALIFERQLLQNPSNPGLFPSGENIDDKFGYINTHAGLLWLFKPTEKHRVYLGGAAFNVNQPKESFLGKTNKLNMRLVGHGGAELAINDKIGIHPSVLYMSQSGSSEINFGTALSIALQGSFDPKLFFGAYYRLGDAVIPVVSLDYKNVRVGLSYDVNMSDLNTATNYKGGFEVSLNYTGCISSIVDVEPIQWCPRF